MGYACILKNESYTTLSMVKPATSATKADLKALEERILKMFKFSLKEMTLRFDDSVKEMKLYFDVKTEQLTVDFPDIFNDRTVDLTTASHDHGRRIKRIEDRVGIFS